MATDWSPHPGRGADAWDAMPWAAVREPRWVRLRAPERERPGLSFQLEADHAPPVWPQCPGTQQMQAHLDIQVDDLDGETKRALALGATVEEHQPQEGVRVLRDPHGHPFCLFLPGA
ncbi:VOC family protein [Streptomyces sp. NPDC059957]|uniref:VOC family protein n=1 Tax=unclassified Streptomyces TaxID=2593676 RepID=UPI00365A9B70